MRGDYVEVTLQELERVCRMYFTNTAAARALGISRNRLRSLCQQYDIEQPSNQRTKH